MPRNAGENPVGNKRKPLFPINTSTEYLKRRLDPRYFFYEENFIQLPGINGDYTLTTETVNQPLNKNLEVAGDNMTTALATFNTGGGVTLTTAGADEDQAYIQAHKDAKQSMLDDIQWKSAQQPYINADIVTAATVSEIHIYCGFMDGTSIASAATAEALFAAVTDGFYFLFADTNAGSTLASTSNWNCCRNVNGTDTAVDSSKAVSASTLYRLEAWLDKDRKPHYYINDKKITISSNTAITDVTDLNFFIGVTEEGSGDARAVTVRRFAVSQLYS